MGEHTLLLIVISCGIEVGCMNPEYERVFTWHEQVICPSAFPPRPTSLDATTPATMTKQITGHLPFSALCQDIDLNTPRRRYQIPLFIRITPRKGF
jgi:hypothetical protein